jgi:hypothetical protein
MDMTVADWCIADLGITEDPGRDASDTERARIARDLAPVDGLGWIGEETTIRVHDLPFYEGADLVIAADSSWEPEGVHACWLRHANLFWRLNGQSAPIHDLNGKVGVRLGRQSALPYLRFFCYFVRGEDGPFIVAEERTLSRLAQDVRAAVEANVVPADLLGEDRQGSYHAAAVVIYGTALFAARFRIHPSGMVEMVDDEPLDGGLPARIGAPLNVTGPRPD